MKGQVAAILVVAAVIVGAGVGYFGNTTASRTTTQTLTSTFTTTVTLPQGGSEVVRCVLTQYAVWEIAHIEGNTTSYGSTTETSDLRTYETTTSVIQTVGYVTTYTSSYTGTITGALAEGNYTTCTYIPG
jgi:hypothetical protein